MNYKRDVSLRIQKKDYKNMNKQNTRCGKQTTFLILW